MKKFTEDQIYKAIQKNYYTYMNKRVESTTFYTRFICSNWKPGDKLVRLADSTKFELMIWELVEIGSYNNKVTMKLPNGIIEAGFDSYRFIPLSWLEAHKPYYPEWL